MSRAFLVWAAIAETSLAVRASQVTVRRLHWLLGRPRRQCGDFTPKNRGLTSALIPKLPRNPVKFPQCASPQCAAIPIRHTRATSLSRLRAERDLYIAASRLRIRAQFMRALG